LVFGHFAIFIANSNNLAYNTLSFYKYWNQKLCKTKLTIGMLTVRIFSQFSFHFPIQFLIKNESKNESKIGLFMKKGLYGPFS